MKAKAVRLLMLAAVCTVALWPPATSHAWPTCVGQPCPFWRNVCEIGGGTFTQTENGYCIQENETATINWDGVCTYPNRDPWSVSCTGI